VPELTTDSHGSETAGKGEREIAQKRKGGLVLLKKRLTHLKSEGKTAELSKGRKKRGEVKKALEFEAASERGAFRSSQH